MIKYGGLFLSSSVLMLLLTFLLFKLSLLGLHDFEVGLPSFLAMQDHLTSSIDAVGYFGKRVIPTSTAYPHLLVADPVLLPAEVAFVNEPTDAADLSAVKGK